MAGAGQTPMSKFAATHKRRVRKRSLRRIPGASHNTSRAPSSSHKGAGTAPPKAPKAPKPKVPKAATPTSAVPSARPANNRGRYKVRPIVKAGKPAKGLGIQGGPSTRTFRGKGPSGEKVSMQARGGRKNATGYTTATKGKLRVKGANAATYNFKSQSSGPGNQATTTFKGPGLTSTKMAKSQVKAYDQRLAADARTSNMLKSRAKGEKVAGVIKKQGSGLGAKVGGVDMGRFNVQRRAQDLMVAAKRKRAALGGL